MNTEIKDSLSVSLGIVLGNNIKSGGFTDINAEVFLETINKVMRNEKLPLTESEATDIINAEYRKNLEKKAEKNLKEGQEFLAKNAKEQGVVTLPSGLQYKVIKEGTGKKPTTSDRVKVHYHGTLIDGTVFDSSVERKQPIDFGVTQVIKGWTEALQRMAVGAKWILYIPTELAYGANPRPGGVIEPNHALIFEVELLDIVK